MTDVDRFVAGMAVVFDEPDLHGVTWRADQFRSFVDAQFGLDALFEHRDPCELLRHAAVGTWSHWHLYEGGGDIPPGLITLGPLTDEYLLEEVRRSLPPFPATEPYGLSMRAAKMTDTPADTWWLTEVSYTRRPAVPRARVFGVGADALQRYELLSGEAVRV